MPRKPNYRFERSERDRQKARKKEERLAQKQERSASRRDGDDTAAGESPSPEGAPGDRTEG